jgi:hypothetical protein
VSQPRPAGIRIQRPYDTDEDFIRGDGLAIGRLGMILIGAPKRPPGITIRFEVVLRSGDAVFRGEGRVVAHRVHANGREGLEIRFTRLDSRSKALVEQVLTLRRTGALAPASMPPPSMREEPSGAHGQDANSPSEGPIATPSASAVVEDASPSAQPAEVLDSAEFAPIESAPQPVAQDESVRPEVALPGAIAEQQGAVEQASQDGTEDATEEPPLDEDPTPFAPPVMLEQLEGGRSEPATEPPRESVEALAEVEPEELEPEELEPEEEPINAPEPRLATQAPPPPKPARPPVSGDVEAVLARLRSRSGGFEGPAAAVDVLARLRQRAGAS